MKTTDLAKKAKKSEGEYVFGAADTGLTLHFAKNRNDKSQVTQTSFSKCWF